MGRTCRRPRAMLRSPFGRRYGEGIEIDDSRTEREHIFTCLIRRGRLKRKFLPEVNEGSPLQELTTARPLLLSLWRYTFAATAIDGRLTLGYEIVFSCSDSVVIWSRPHGRSAYKAVDRDL
jgi:hypothetical protein